MTTHWGVKKPPVSSIWWFPFRHRGTLSHHPFLGGIFPIRNQPFLGTPHLWKPPKKSHRISHVCLPIFGAEIWGAIGWTPPKKAIVRWVGNPTILIILDSPWQWTPHRYRPLGPHVPQEDSGDSANAATFAGERSRFGFGSMLGQFLTVWNDRDMVGIW